MGGKVGIHWERQKCKNNEEFARGNKKYRRDADIKLEKNKG